MPRLSKTVTGALKRHLPGLARSLSGISARDDRRVLETVILPALCADPAVGKLLFDGTEWYNQPYKEICRDVEYWTIDIDPALSRYGSRLHVVDALKNLGQHFVPGYFDAIVCNGVFWVGAMDTAEEAEPGFTACHACLRAGGWFVLGWNDVDALRPYPLDDSAALKDFDPRVFPALAATSHVTETDDLHTFTFFTKA